MQGATGVFIDTPANHKRNNKEVTNLINLSEWNNEPVGNNEYGAVRKQD